MGDVSGGVSCERGDVMGEVDDARARMLAARVARARLALTAAESALVNVTVEAVRSGALSQVAAAREAGVDRHTVRAWLGLPRRRPGRHAGSR
jgi:hypothetical protein